MGVTFALGGDSVVISENYISDSERIPEPGTVVGETEGGTLIAQDVGADRVFWNLEFVGLTLAKKEELLAFFNDIIRARYRTFTFTDKDSSTYTVTWWNEFAIHPEVNTDWERWSGLIILRQ